MDTRQRIIDLLISTNRYGIQDLIKRMDESGFFTAPCSSKYHLDCEGGLAEHSFNVYVCLKELVESFSIGTEITEDSIIICALLHDLGKMGDYGQPNYIKAPLLKSGKEPAQKYKTNPDIPYEEHEVRSLTIALKYIDLTMDEYTAILHHGGLFGKLDSSFGNHNYDSNKLAFLLHTADMYASRFIESKEKGEEE